MSRAPRFSSKIHRSIPTSDERFWLLSDTNHVLGRRGFIVFIDLVRCV